MTERRNIEYLVSDFHFIVFSITENRHAIATRQDFQLNAIIQNHLVEVRI